jgi:hypothetical protein
VVETNSFGGTPLVLAEYRSQADAGAESTFGGIGAASSRRVLFGEQAAACGRLDGADDEGHYGYRRRDLRGTDRFVLCAGEGTGRRRVGSFARETCQDTRNKGGNSGDSDLKEGNRRAGSLCDFRDDRANGHNARRTNCGSDVGVAAAHPADCIRKGSTRLCPGRGEPSTAIPGTFIDVSGPAAR